MKTISIYCEAHANYFSFPSLGWNQIFKKQQSQSSYEQVDCNLSIIIVNIYNGQRFPSNPYNAFINVSYVLISCLV